MNILLICSYINEYFVDLFKNTITCKIDDISALFYDLLISQNLVRWLFFISVAQKR